MSKEEIKDFLDVSSKKDIVDLIYNLESELLRTQQSLDTARAVIKNSVSKDKYNSIVKKYNEIAKRRGMR